MNTKNIYRTILLLLCGYLTGALLTYCLLPRETSNEKVDNGLSTQLEGVRYTTYIPAEDQNLPQGYGE